MLVAATTAICRSKNNLDLRQFRPPGILPHIRSAYLDHQSTQFRLSASELLLFVSVVLVLINALYGIPNCDDLVS